MSDKDVSNSLKNMGINELLRERFINALDDFVSLDKKITETREAFTEVIGALPDAIDSRISDKLQFLLKTADELNDDLDNAKSELKDYTQSLSTEFNKNIALFLSGLEKEIKPVSFLKIVAISAFSVILMTSSVSFVMYQFIKKDSERNLYIYAETYKQTSDILEKNIKFLPKDKQEVVSAELNIIKTRQMP